MTGWIVLGAYVAGWLFSIRWVAGWMIASDGGIRQADDWSIGSAMMVSVLACSFWPLIWVGAGVYSSPRLLMLFTPRVPADELRELQVEEQARRIAELERELEIKAVRKEKTWT